MKRGFGLTLVESVQFILDEYDVITVDESVTRVKTLEGKRVDEI